MATKQEKCGCITRKITKTEKKDYPEEVTVIVEKFCEKHQPKPKKAYFWKCPECGKTIESLHQNQFETNIAIHRVICQRRRKKK